MDCKIPFIYIAETQRSRMIMSKTGSIAICYHTNQWCSPGMLTRGALQKIPELAGGVLQYDILEILNFVGGYSSSCETNIQHYSY
jgi:hypothetical protein